MDTMLKGRPHWAAGLVLAAIAMAAAPGWAQVSGLDMRPANGTCLAGAAPSRAVQVQQVWPELSSVSPFDVRLTPDKSEFYAIARQGKVYRFTPGSAPTLVLDIASRVGVNNQDNAYADPPQGSENWGLVSLAFHPDFQQNGWMFVLYNGRQANDPYTTSSVARYTLKPDRSAFDGASGLVIIQQAQPNGNLHHFGHLAFGPDGYLYVGSGDGSVSGPSEFPKIRAQHLDDLRGKIMRLDVNNSSPQAPYAIPTDNPFNGVAGAKWEVFARGFRNPWRFSFDSATGELWVGDVGQGDIEEVSIVPPGGNMGWNVFEGTLCHTDFPGPGTCATIPTVPPVAEISHGGEFQYRTFMSVTGGFVYRGSALPSLFGKYVFALYGPNTVYTVSRENNQVTLNKLLDTPTGIASFFTDGQNELYGIDPFKAVIYKFVAGAGGGDTRIPQLLSQTGCVDPLNPQVASQGMIPYGVRSELWSDGADKTRWIALPNGASIDIQNDGDFSFPNGSVLMKTFLFQGSPVETRLLKHHDDGSWAGYTYEWTADRANATLVPDGGKNVQVLDNAGVAIGWRFPSRGECLICHTQAADFVLGPEIAQLNYNFAYPSTGRIGNQLVTWDHVGLFSGPLPGGVASLPALADYGNAAWPVADRARSYLHSNCSMCHRPSNPIRATMDLRYQSTLAEMNICGVRPNIGELGIVGANLFYPARPDLSMIPARMSIRGANQMPPVASTIVHNQGVNVISTWIMQTVACH